MEDGNVYVYDFSELREDVQAIETDVESVQTQISELNSQVSDIVSYMSVTADNSTSIKSQTETEVILLFSVIAFCGMVCGLLIANCIRK